MSDTTNVTNSTITSEAGRFVTIDDLHMEEGITTCDLWNECEAEAAPAATNQTTAAKPIPEPAPTWQIDIYRGTTKTEQSTPILTNPVCIEVKDSIGIRYYNPVSNALMRYFPDSASCESAAAKDKAE